MRFRIRSKLAAALVVPLVALVVGSGLLAMDARAEAHDVDTQIDLALVALGPGSLTGALQDERNYVALDLLGLAGTGAVSVESFEQAAAATDRAAGQLEAKVGRFDPAVRDKFAPALEALAGLDEVRARYQRFDGARDLRNVDVADEAFGEYRAVIDRFFTATATVAADLDEASLRNGVEISDALNRRGEALSVTIRHLAMDVLSGERSPAAAVAMSASATEARLMQDRIRELAVGPYAVVVDDNPAQQGFEQALATVDRYVAGQDVDLVELLDTEGLGDSTQSDAVVDVLVDRAAAIHGEAIDRMRLYVIAAAAVVSLAILVTYFASTSITRPLRALRREADELATTGLPGAVRSILDTPPGQDVVVPEVAPIRIDTRDEVGDVVEALNEVQQSTLTLAVDQAVLRRNFADSFVNLGRRNQLLLDRQLDFITQLEENETDPEQLDALFRLDHLATRMRRNAESLLVLAGAESPRQWGAPVPVSDLVRSGLSEVEDYQRVNVRHLDDAEVAGQAVAGLAHVLAELAENALAFSPPDEQVEVKGRWSGNGDYVIAIADNGIGMTDEELERANRRLSGREAYTVAPSRYLGHYVAGNLARQLGVVVRLQDDPAGGLVATITLPPALLGTGADAGPGDAAPVPATSVEPIPDTQADPVVEEPVVEEPVEVSVVDAPVVEGPADEPVEEPAALDGLGDEWTLDSWGSPDRWTEQKPSPEPDLDDILYGAQQATPEEPAAAPVPEPSASPAPPSADLTEDGLPRRVPGAQRPDVSPLSGRRAAASAEPAAAAPALEPPVWEPSEDADESTTAPAPDPGGAFGFLQAFQSGGVPSTNGDRAHHESTEDER